MLKFLWSVLTGLIKRLLSNSTHAQFLMQADHLANDKKGLNLASLLKKVFTSTHCYFTLKWLMYTAKSKNTLLFSYPCSRTLQIEIPQWCDDIKKFCECFYLLIYCCRFYSALMSHCKLLQFNV